MKLERIQNEYLPEFIEFYDKEHDEMTEREKNILFMFCTFVEQKFNQEKRGGVITKDQREWARRKKEMKAKEAESREITPEEDFEAVVNS